MKSGSINSSNLTLTLCEGEFAICRLDASARPPEWAQGGKIWSITRTADELSIVCSQKSVPEGVRSEGGWRCLKLEGPLDFSLTGILVSLAAPLAEAGISIFAISTFDTDYLLVNRDDLERSVDALEGAGHLVRR